jgi:hypothetical protein
MPEVGGASETDRMSDAERTVGMKRPQGDDRAPGARSWFQPVRPVPPAESSPAEAATPADASAADTSAADATPAEDSPADASPAQDSSVVAGQPATTSKAGGSDTGSGSAEATETETYTEPDTIMMPMLRVSSPRAQNGTGRPPVATPGRSSAEAKTVPSAPAAAQTPPAPAPAGARRPPLPGGGGSNGGGSNGGPNGGGPKDGGPKGGVAAGKTRGYYSGSKSPAWPDALDDTEPETVILPKLVVSRPPAKNGTAAASNATRATGRTATTGQRQPAEAKAVRPDELTEPETMLLPIIRGSRSQPQAGPLAGRAPARDAKTASSPGAASPGATRNGPVKFIASLSRRLKRAIGRHRPLIVALAAVVAIAAAATLISVRLDASPRPSGAPPVDIPSPGGKSQVVQVATSSSWPTTAPAAVPASCKQASLKGVTGASVVSYLDDNTSQANLVAREAKGLDLLDFSWTSVASPTHLVRSDSFDPTLTTELTAANQSGPCGLRFATLSDNDPSMSHSADVRMMTQILTSSSVRQAHVLAVAQWMASQPLATGLTIDYENGLPQNLGDLKTAEKVAGWSGLSLDEAVNQLSNDYTGLIGEIAAAMHRQHRLVRLMAPVRDSDDVDAATTDIAPYLLNYGALAGYVDQVVLEAYNFSYATSNPGPIAPFADVAKVLTYVHSYNVPWSKLAVAEPLFAYDWAVNKNGDIAVNAKGQTISATTLTATKLAAGKKQWKTVKTEDGETEYSYTQAGQQHIVWDASSALKTEMAWLKRNYAQIGVDVSGIGNADPTGSALAVTALGS